MKFGKRFEAYLAQNVNLPEAHVGVKSLKKILKRCKGCHKKEGGHLCHATECNQRFFQKLTQNMEAVLGEFNIYAKKLLKVPLVSGRFFRLFSWGTGSIRNDDLLDRCHALIAYVAMNHLAVRKLIKKFEKVHGPVADLEFKRSLLSVDRQLMRSPFLLEINALSKNLSKFLQIDCGEDSFGSSSSLSSMEVDSSPEVEGMLESEMTESEKKRATEDLRVYTDHSCPICIETLFDPVALGCGHVFCNICACEAADTPASFGIQRAPQEATCPFCRQSDVFKTAVRLKELDLFLKRRSPARWEARKKMYTQELHKQRSEVFRRQEERARRWTQQEEARRRAAGRTGVAVRHQRWIPQPS